MDFPLIATALLLTACASGAVLIILILLADTVDQKKIEIHHLKRRLKLATQSGYEEGYEAGSDAEAQRWMDAEAEAHEAGRQQGFWDCFDKDVEMISELRHRITELHAELAKQELR